MAVGMFVAALNDKKGLQEFIYWIVIPAMFAAWMIISGGMLVRLNFGRRGTMFTGLLMKLTVFTAALTVAITVDPPLVIGASITVGFITLLLGVGAGALAFALREGKNPAQNIQYQRRRFTELRCDTNFEKAKEEYFALNGQTGRTELTPAESDAVLQQCAGRAVYFLEWLLRRHLLSGAMYAAYTPEQLEQAVQYPEDFFMHSLGGSLQREQLSEDVAYFADRYMLNELSLTPFPLYGQSERYFFDFFDAICTKTGRIYCNAFSPELYAGLEPVLDRRYQDYLREQAEDEDPVTVRDIPFRDDTVEVRSAFAEPEQIERCIQHFLNWDADLRAEAEQMLQGSFMEPETETTDYLSLLTPYQLTVYPGKEPAYIIDGETELDEEHGFSIVIRGNHVVEIGNSMKSGSPNSLQNEIFSQISEGIGWKRIVNLKTVEEAEELAGQGLLVKTSADGETIYVPPLVAEAKAACEKKLAALQAMGWCDTVRCETLFRGEYHIIPRALYISGDKDGKRVFFDCFDVLNFGWLA